MIHIFINAMAASAGGGLTYIRNVMPHLAARADVKSTILISHLAGEFTTFSNISVLERPSTAAVGLRFWREQRSIPKLIQQNRADVLITTGNFAVWNSPVPQILLSRNALYTSKDFWRDLRVRGDYRLWLETNVKAALARASIARAECTVAPSIAFASQLRRWTGIGVCAIHHGFDREKFLRNGAPLPTDVQTKLAEAHGALRLLFVSHYNYYRNFGTLIRALPILKKRLAPRKLKLILTCTFRGAENPGCYDPAPDAALLNDLGVVEDVVQLDAIPYELLHRLYAVCDIYVSPAYAESFAHPLLEAMASGLPIVASDLPVHREVCQQAAVYFAPFCHEELADRICGLASSPDVLCNMRAEGLQRASAFSWKRHVDELLALAAKMVERRTQTENSISVPVSR